MPQNGSLPSFFQRIWETLLRDLNVGRLRDTHGIQQDACQFSARL